MAEWWRHIWIEFWWWWWGMLYLYCGPMQKFSCGCILPYYDKKLHYPRVCLDCFLKVEGLDKSSCSCSLWQLELGHDDQKEKQEDKTWAFSCWLVGFVTCSWMVKKIYSLWWCRIYSWEMKPLVEVQLNYTRKQLNYNLIFLIAYLIHWGYSFSNSNLCFLFTF